MSMIAGPVVARQAPTDTPSTKPVAFVDAPAPARAWASGVTVPLDKRTLAPATARSRGRAADVVEIVLPGRSWAELTTANAVFRDKAVTAARTVWTVPLAFSGNDPAETAAGRRDLEWDGLGRVLAQQRGQTVVRLLAPSGADPAVARAAFQRTARSIKARAAGVMIEWTAPVGTTPDMAKSWPGAESVDVVGLSTPSTGEWPQLVNAPGGLTDWTDWARAQGKPVALHWSLAKDTNPTWVRNISNWVKSAAANRKLGYEAMSVGHDPAKDAVATYLQLW